MLLLIQKMQPTQLDSKHPHCQVIPHESTDISSEVASAGRRAEVLLRVEPICVDHEVAVRQIAAMYKEDDAVGLFSTCNKLLVISVYSHFWRFGLVLSIEEFRQCTFLYRVNAGKYGQKKALDQVIV